MTSTLQCKLCLEQIKSTDTKINCFNCVGLFHRNCANLMLSEVKVLERQNTNLKWFCNICETEKSCPPLETSIVDTSSNLKSIDEKILEYDNLFKSNENGDKVPKLELNNQKTNGGYIESLKDQNQFLKTEMIEMRKLVTKLVERDRKYSQSTPNTQSTF